MPPGHIAIQQGGWPLSTLDAFGTKPSFRWHIALTHGAQAVDVLFLAKGLPTDGDIVEPTVASLACHYTGHTAHGIDQGFVLARLHQFAGHHRDRLGVVSGLASAFGGDGDLAGVTPPGTGLDVHIRWGRCWRRALHEFGQTTVAH